MEKEHIDLRVNFDEDSFIVDRTIVEEILSLYHSKPLEEIKDLFINDIKTSHNLPVLIQSLKKRLYYFEFRQRTIDVDYKLEDEEHY